MRTKKRIKQSVQMRARTRTTRVGLPARHEVEILPSTTQTRTPNAVRDSLSKRLIARMGARPPIGKEESVSGASASGGVRGASPKKQVDYARRRGIGAGTRVGAGMHRSWGASPAYGGSLLFCLRSVRRKVVEQAQWGGTRKSAKYKKRGGDIREDLYPNVLHFSVSADAYPLPKYARPVREPPLETWGSCAVGGGHCVGEREVVAKLQQAAGINIGARKYGRREDSGHAGHKVIK
ncbi:hypothetical protein B0H13DRAFT_2277889 [Mycena leptocephala]|nr:hypothetical protein B0H13DRAFT_2277889 [Mycena leptocephala]